MSQHIGPRTISAIGGSIKRVGNYRIHTFPSELVTDGLVLNLDAGDPRSYPSSGTTWTDLSGNGNNGTLVNGPTYSNADGGFIDFVSSSTVRVPVSSSLQTNYYTIDLWVKIDSISEAIILSNHFQANGTVSGVVINTSSSGVLTFQSRLNNICCQTYTSSTLSTDTWYNLVFTWDGSFIKIYINNSLVNTISQTGTHQNINDFYLANNSDEIVGGSYTSNNFDGKISSFKYYNRALSPAEVAQNYDALRVRYGSYTSTFTPICAGGEGKVEVLCVAGGGGGGIGDNGQGGGGGGGAGGLLYNSAFTVDSNSGVSLSIGQGGVYTSEFDNGDNTTFGSLTSIGGGSGNAGLFTAGPNSRKGGDGGSGGGGFREGAAGGSGVAGQGNDGGSAGTGSGLVGGGGGGGAGSAGQNGNGVIGGTGGSGLSYSISGESKYYAAGGGGGGHNTIGALGGSGIGGDGGPSTIGLNAVPNTGSGGGGGRGGTGISRRGGNGANGTVIVRYPATDYNVEVLVVGGGGGGGNDIGGGGGAGGLIYNSSYPVSAGTKYTVIVGPGGTGGTSTYSTAGTSPTNGGNSTFGSLVSFGGGAGGSRRDGPVTGNLALSGGSGGGGGFPNQLGASGIFGQGNSGGNSGSSSGPGGGGGGAGGSGANGSTSGSAAGGTGLTYSITGTSITYAVGGNGGTQAATQAGSTTAGSGGSGGGNNPLRSPAPPGVSGIVIIAYKGPQRGIGGTVDTTSRPGYTLHKFTAVGTDFFIP